ncbi:MAG TPA: GTPase Era, partial [Burkholderiaceae bacterium]|nr:GTPase Era [Burkholderiaceae bacterium]
RMMNRVVRQTLSEVDVVLHVTEAGKWTAADENLLPLLPHSCPVILVPNKIDRMPDKDQLLPYVSERMEAFAYEAVVPISAWRGTQTDHLLNEIASRLPAGEHLFEADALTDRPVRFLAAEIIREKIFRFVGDELPYGCTVFIEKWDESDRGVQIAACVLVERDSHRPILLGAQGQHMKRIATEARQDIVKLVDKPVFLNVYIKVRKGWSQHEGLLRELGYE